MSTERITRRREAVVLLGNVLVVVGLAAWDWRVACVVYGVVLTAAGLVALVRGA